MLKGDCKSGRTSRSMANRHRWRSFRPSYVFSVQPASPTTSIRGPAIRDPRVNRPILKPTLGTQRTLRSDASNGGIQFSRNSVLLIDSSHICVRSVASTPRANGSFRSHHPLIQIQAANRNIGLLRARESRAVEVESSLFHKGMPRSCSFT